MSRWPNPNENTGTEQTWLVGQACSFAGVSVRQLQWWDEHGIVTPLQQGHRRLYSSRQAAEIALLAELRSKGISLQRSRSILRFLRRELGRPGVAGLPGLYLIVTLTPDGLDKDRCRLENEPGEIIRVIEQATRPVVLVSLWDKLKGPGAASAASDSGTSPESETEPVGRRRPPRRGPA